MLDVPMSEWRFASTFLSVVQSGWRKAAGRKIYAAVLLNLSFCL